MVDWTCQLFDFVFFEIMLASFFRTYWLNIYFVDSLVGNCSIYRSPSPCEKNENVCVCTIRRIVIKGLLLYWSTIRRLKESKNEVERVADPENNKMQTFRLFGK